MKIHDDIETIIINDNIKYKYNFIKRENKTSELGKKYYNSIKKIINEKDSIMLNPIYYLCDYKFLSNNNFIPFFDIEINKEDFVEKIYNIDENENNWSIKEYFINSIQYSFLLNIIKKLKKNIIKKIIIHSKSIKSILKYIFRNEIIEIELFDKLKIKNLDKKKYDFIDINLYMYEYKKNIDLNLENIQLNNLIKILNIILNNLNDGGNINFYTVSIFNDESKNIIHLISELFEYVYIIKPHAYHYSYALFICCTNYKNKEKSKFINILNQLKKGDKIIDIEKNETIYRNDLLIDIFNETCIKYQKNFFINDKNKKYLFDNDDLVNFYSNYKYNLNFKISEYYINKKNFNLIKKYCNNNVLFYNYYDSDLIYYCLNNLDINNKLFILDNNYRKIKYEGFYRKYRNKVFIKPDNLNILSLLLSEYKFDNIIIGNIYLINDLEIKNYLFLLFLLLKNNGYIIINIYNLFYFSKNKNIKEFYKHFIRKYKHHFTKIFKDEIYVIYKKIKKMDIKTKIPHFLRK